MTMVTLVKVHKAYGVEVVRLSNGHFVSLTKSLKSRRLPALDRAMWQAQPRRCHFAYRRAIEQFIAYKWPIEWTLDDLPIEKDPNMHASNYAVTFTCRSGIGAHPDQVVAVFKEALGIHGDSFHDLVEQFRSRKPVRVIINSDQFVKFFMLRREWFNGNGIRWGDAELVSNSEVITDLSHLR